MHPFYVAALNCKRCGATHMVCKMAERFHYWYCHWRADGMRCGTFNVWK